MPGGMAVFLIDRHFLIASTLLLPAKLFLGHQLRGYNRRIQQSYDLVGHIPD